MYSYFSRCYVTTNSVAPPPLYKLHTTHNSLIRSDEGLTLETSALESLYGGQFTLSTPLILPKFSIICVHSATRHNIHMYPYFLFAAIHHLNRPRLSLSDLVAQSAE